MHTTRSNPTQVAQECRRGESGGFLLYALFAVILLSSLGFLPEINVDYGSVIDSGFVQASEAAGMDPKDYILAYWQWSDPWYILDADGKKHYFLIDNPKEVEGGFIHDWNNEKFIVNLTVKPMDGSNRTLKFTLVYPWPH